MVGGFSIAANRQWGQFMSAEFKSPRPRDVVPAMRRAYTSAKAVGSFIPALTAPAFRKFGFSAATLVTDWPAIAGRELASVSSPQRLVWPKAGHGANAEDRETTPARRKGATLIVRVDGARALDVQYGSRQIIERINAYFGYAAIDSLRIVQAPHSAAANPSAAPRRGAQPAATREVMQVADVRLREALAKLAGQVNAAR
jgi:hypothetical protein